MSDSPTVDKPRKRRRRWLRRVWGGAIIVAAALIACLLLGLLALYLHEARSPRLVCLMYHRFVSDEVYSAIGGDERKGMSAAKAGWAARQQASTIHEMKSPSFTFTRSPPT